MKLNRLGPVHDMYHIPVGHQGKNQQGTSIEVGKSWNFVPMN